MGPLPPLFFVAGQCFGSDEYILDLGMPVAYRGLQPLYGIGYFLEGEIRPELDLHVKSPVDRPMPMAGRAAAAKLLLSKAARPLQDNTDRPACPYLWWANWQTGS
jgi:hypothetical protein